MLFSGGVGQNGYGPSRGVSLLETVIATLLFATVSVSVVSLWYSHYRLMALSQFRMAATYVCKELMEDQLSQPYLNIVPIARGSQAPIVMDSVVNGNSRRVVYDWCVKVVDTPSTKDVTVQVFWKEANVEHETHLETLLFTLY